MIPRINMDRAITARRLGVNLAGVNYWATAWPFVDMVKIGSPWQSLNGSSLDANGYPISVISSPPFMYVYTGANGHYPRGTYVLTWEGAGDVQMQGRTPVNQNLTSVPKRRTYSISAIGGVGHRIQINSTPVDKIKLWMDGYEGAASVFHPLFKERLAPFDHIRFMDWGSTNNSKQSKWSDRREVNYATQTDTPAKSGVSYEYMVDLCNEVGITPWICIPHLADDDYVKNLAALIRGRLNPDLSLCIEFSNEVWNASFRQYHDVTALAKGAGVPYERWLGRRIAEVWNVFSRQWGGSNRLIRILGGQNANPWWTTEVLTGVRSAGQEPDLLATTTYFNDSLGDKLFLGALGINYKNPQAVDYDAAFKYLLDSVRPGGGTYTRWQGFLTMARREGVPVTAYEGGSHTTPSTPQGQNDTALTSFLHTLNRDSRIKEVYQETLNNFHSLGAWGHTAFTYCEGWTKYGPWGHLEYQDQPLDQAPKYEFLIEQVNTLKR